MTRKGKGRNTPSSPKHRGVVVLAGEDRHDCEILAALIRAHRPDLTDTAKLVRVNDPVRLRKKTGAKLTAAVETLVGKARAKALQQRAQLYGIVVHEDLDQVTDSDYRAVRRRVADALDRQRGSSHAVFALAAWESEAWLLLFPDAFPKVRLHWKVPARLRGKDSGRIRDPKEELKRTLGNPRFRESDGPLVAQAALDNGLLASPVGTNRSYGDFLADLDAWA
ncbi:hypothetical protein LHJ74_12585 [Streptomyces sp. N2-109]|uniref:DUF4276 family protein n=1 Tax=Streptomyces gossypii TaxID=2883101 RepID=A0ABT2JS70_9ACTN|nr:hypothetical protein [Streptomyces gossypii]MCT2590736.1 hypothetical protein [Streptomyces gossypii]